MQQEPLKQETWNEKATNKFEYPSTHISSESQMQSNDHIAHASPGYIDNNLNSPKSVREQNMTDDGNVIYNFQAT